MQENLINLLKSHNPWWQTHTIPSERDNLPKRDLFETLEKCLEEKRISALTGPRRAGKTVILYQLIKLLLEKENKPFNILYLLCDDPDLSLILEKTTFGEVINFYRTEIADSKSKIYVFLDEVHSIFNWEKWLKKFYDLSYPIKFIISGSAALHIKKKTKESLAGRLLEYSLYPLGFKEFVRFHNFFAPDEEVETENIPESFEEKYFFSSKNRLNFSMLQEKLIRIFEKFILWGGFPEGFNTKSLTLWQDKLNEDVIKKQIYYDIVKVFEIENPSLIEKTLYFIGKNQSQIFNFETFMSALPFRSKNTVINYLSYLSESFLIGENLKFSKKALVKARKYFLLDSGLLNMILKNQNLLEIKSLGLIIEGIIQTYAYLNYEDVRYYRNPRGREIDLIMNTKEGLLPIEVKYVDKFNTHDIKNLVYFMTQENLDKALILTKNVVDLIELGSKKKIYLLPVWEFLI